MKAVIVCKKADSESKAMEPSHGYVRWGRQSSFSCIPFFKWMVPWRYLP